MKLQRTSWFFIAFVMCGTFLGAVDYYKVLGLTPGAARADIRAKCEGLKARAMTGDEVNACTILLDPAQRSSHDSAIWQEQAQKGGLEAVTYYAVLGLDRSATIDAIVQKCNAIQGMSVSAELQKQYGSEAAFRKRAQEVCTVLKDPRKKEQYDKQLPPEDVELGVIRALISGFKKESDVLLVNVLGQFLSQIPIPGPALSVFNQQLAMRDMRFVPAPYGFTVRTGLGFTGAMLFNQLRVEATVYVVKDINRKMQYSLSVSLPEHYKISSMFPNFKKIDVLSLPKAKFVLSSFGYFDPEGYQIKPGFNFISSLDLTGPLKFFSDLKDGAKKLKSIVIRSEPIRFQGVIPRDITKTEFSATIPIYFGIDFTKIPDMPKSITKIFKEITTDDFVFVITAPPKLSFTIENGVRLVLGTQPTPIRLSAFAIIEQSGFSLGIRMRNLLELSKWLALGNAGIQLDWDYALAPVAMAFGIPFTGIGFNGEIDVGKPGVSRAVFKIGGGVRVKSQGFPDLVLDVSADNIKFNDLLSLLVKTVGKGLGKSFSPAQIPLISVDHVRGFLALDDTKIAGKYYDAGFALEADVDMFGFKGGFSFDLKHTALTASGSGYMSNIDVNVKGKPIFRLTGPKFITRGGKEVEGPAVDFSFGLKDPTKGSFGIRGILDIPPINLKEDVRFRWSGWNLDADFESKLFGFGIIFGVNINLKEGKTEKPVELPVAESKTAAELAAAEKATAEAKKEKWRHMRIKFGFKGEFVQFLSEHVKPAIDSLRNSTSKKLAALNEEIGKLSTKLSDTSKKAGVSMNVEITNTRATINGIKKKIDDLKRERKATKNIIKKATLTTKIGAQRSALVAQEIYLNTLLKPAKVVAVETTLVLSKMTEALHKAKLLKTAVEKSLEGLSKATSALIKGVSIFRLKEAIGEFSTSEILKGKSPTLKSLIIETTIPGLPQRIELRELKFDFKSPVRSIQEIAQKVSYALLLAASKPAAA